MIDSTAATPYRPRNHRSGAGAILLAAVAAGLASLALAPAAHAGQIVDRIAAGDKTTVIGFGEPPATSNDTKGTGEGLLDFPEGIAFNDPAVADGSTDPQGASTDGYLYVVDKGNQRVQAFDATGNFKFMFGRGVLSGGDGAEVCDHTQVPCGDPEPQADDEEGEFHTPVGLAIDQASGDLYVHDVRNRRIQQFAADGSFIRAWGWGVSDGSSEFQICEAPADLPCQAGVPGGGGGQLDWFHITGSVAVDPSPPHHVFVGDSRNQRVQEFEPDGSFVRLWGWDVVPSGQPGDLGNSFEICESTAAGACKEGASESFAKDGRFGKGDPTQMAIHPDGTLYAATPGPIARFDTNATTPEALQMHPLAIDSDRFAVDPGSENLLAFIFESSIGALAIAEYDLSAEPATEVDRHVVSETGSGAVNPQEIAVDPASGDIHFSTNSSPGHRVFAADADGAPPATMTIDPPSAEGFGATFTATITPNGPPGFNTTYNFQYSRDGGETWITLAGSENPLGDSSGPVEVSDEVSGLEPNSQYKVRLITRKSFANPETISEAFDFSTPAIPPTAETLKPSSRADTEALLAGLVNPNNSQTDYYFEWGTDASYGNLTPVAHAGEGFGEVGALTRITGLEPNTTYHYRLVADNGVEVEAGITEVRGGDRSFTTRARFQGFPSRGYEQVSPVDKNGESVRGDTGEGGQENFNSGLAISPDGSAAAFDGGLGVFADADWIPNAVGGTLKYQARRNPAGDGWMTKLSSPRPSGSSGGGIGASLVRHVFYGGPQDSLLAAYGPLLIDPPGLPQPGSYLRRWQDGGLTAVAAIPGLPQALDSPVVGASADMSRVFYESEEVRMAAPALPAEAAKLYEWRHPAEPGAPEGNERQLVAAWVSDGGTFRLRFDGKSTAPIPYDASASLVQTRLEALANIEPGDVEIYDSSPLSDFNFWRIEFAGNLAGEDVPQLEGDGSELTSSHGFDTYLQVRTEPPARFVSVDAEGDPFPGDVTLGGPGVKRTAVSDDGEHVFFTTPSNGSNLPDDAKIYRRSHGAITTLASPSKAASPDPMGERGKHFAAATDDGSRLFFLSAEQLTDDANTGPERKGTDLYRYDVQADELIDVSASSNDEDGAQVRGILGIDETADTVYFVARGQLVAGRGQAGASNVYRWREDGTPGGEIRYLATLAGGAADDVNLGAFGGEASSEGKTSSRVSADGEVLLFQSVAELTGNRNRGHAQLFVYEAEGEGGAGTLSCVSCRADGSPAHGAAGIPETVVPSESGDALVRALSKDGSRVTFHSDDDLLAADKNGLRDVYAWEEGRLQLISPAGAWPSGLHGASADGSDIFFVTREQLVGQDRDGLRDLYDARVGGGIAAQSPPPPGEHCAGEGCKPPPEASPPPTPPASAGLVSQGNVPPRVGCGRFAAKTKKLRKRAKRSHRHARRLAKRGKRGKARRMNRKARRFGKQAKRLGKRARRCRTAQRRNR